MPMPATTIASSSSGFRKPPGSSAKPRQAYIAIQVVAAATAGEQDVGGEVPRARLTTAGSSTGPTARPGGPTPRAPLGAGVAELLPDRVEPVARAERDRPPALGAEQPGSRPAPAGAPAQASTSSAIASAEPAWCCIRRSTGRSAGSTAPKTATVSPPCAPSVSQPVSRRPLADLLDDGERLEQRAGVEVGVAEVPGAAGVLAGRGDQADGEAAVAQVHRDRRRGRDRGLERGRDAVAAVRDGAVVEEERRPGLPGLLLAAHHQLADPRRAAPVHPAQVVAAAVLADRDVLGAAGRERARPVVAGAGPGAAERDLGEQRRCAG